MQFDTSQIAVGKAYRGKAFHLPPSASTVCLAKKRANFNTNTRRDGFDISNSADNIKFHLLIVSQNRCSGKPIKMGHERLVNSIEVMTGISLNLDAAIDLQPVR